MGNGHMASPVNRENDRHTPMLNVTLYVTVILGILPGETVVTDNHRCTSHVDKPFILIPNFY